MARRHRPRTGPLPAQGSLDRVARACCGLPLLVEPPLLVRTASGARERRTGLRCLGCLGSPVRTTHVRRSVDYRLTSSLPNDAVRCRRNLRDGLSPDFYQEIDHDHEKSALAYDIPGNAPSDSLFGPGRHARSVTRRRPHPPDAPIRREGENGRRFERTCRGRESVGHDPAQGGRGSHSRPLRCAPCGRS